MNSPERRGQRKPFIETGTLRLGLFKRRTCELRDVSSGGARFITPDDTELPEEFYLRTPHFDRPRRCVLRWQSGRETGVEFI